MTLFYSHPIRFWGPICHTLWFLLKQQHDATNACADMPLRFETDEAIELISSPMGKQDMSATANPAVFVLKPFFSQKIREANLFNSCFPWEENIPISNYQKNNHELCNVETIIYLAPDFIGAFASRALQPGGLSQ